MGTPELIMVPRVRVNRATATLRMRGPKMGVLMTKASHWCRPLALLFHALKPTTAAVTPTTMWMM